MNEGHDMKVVAMTRKTIGIVSVILLLAMACGPAEKEVLIPRAEVQRMVEAKFPLEKTVLAARFRLESPKVYFKQGKIGMTLVCVGSLLGKEAKGQAELEGKIVYKKETHAFHLSEFRLSNVTFKDFSFMGTDALNKMVDSMVQSHLDNHPVYVLNSDNWKQEMAKAFLKKVEIRGDDLVATFSL